MKGEGEMVSGKRVCIFKRGRGKWNCREKGCIVERGRGSGIVERGRGKWNSREGAYIPPSAFPQWLILYLIYDHVTIPGWEGLKILLADKSHSTLDSPGSSQFLYRHGPSSGRFMMYRHDRNSSHGV